MAIYQRRQNILLTFKVLQFVNQLRRRVKPRTLDGSSSVCQLGTDALGLRAVKSISNGLPRIGGRHAKPLHHGRRRVCKSRNGKNNVKICSSAPELQVSAPDVSAGSDAAGEEVQQMLRSIDNLNPSGLALSAVAGNEKLFLKHDSAPIFEGYSLNQTIQLLVTVQEAINTVAACRLQYGDDWLVAQGLDFGLDIDEIFIANYEHLLLRLQAELTQALTRKALEELLRGGHDKRQRKLLSWFSEFAEKPRPLSTSFPWTIKPSLAVLWGVCWMFYDRDCSQQDAKAGDRVRRDRVLQQLDFPSSVRWNAPASSDYVNFGLQLIGAQPQHSAQQPSPDNVTAGLEDLFQARNAEFWPSDLSPSDSRLPSHEDVEAIGSLRYGQAPPQLPAQNTYYHDNLPQFPASFHDNSYLPQNPGSPLTVYPQHLGNDESWQLPFASLPQQRSPRHLISTPQTPSIRVTGTTGSDLAPPHRGFVASTLNYNNIYHQPQASQLQLNTNFDFPYDMDTQMSQDTPSIQVPHNSVKHERTSSINSNSNMPTPVSMSGPRSPLLSPTSGERSHIATSPQTHSRHISEDRSSQDGDDDGSLRKNHSYKRAEEPPRNQEGKMMCRHHECLGLYFDRKCEWSKHMDKHDRPYKCTVKGCEKLQGFTYSGGLLRHEREVHKMHGGTKKSLFCPFHDCKRSSGAGFTRKENLAEHIRRVHRRTSMSADMHGLVIRRDMTLEGSPIAESRHKSESPYSRASEYREDEDVVGMKRKRSDDGVEERRGSEDLRAEIKRLRQENEEKDSRLRQLEQAVIALQHQTRR